jgi:hypothetical protein
VKLPREAVFGGIGLLLLVVTGAYFWLQSPTIRKTCNFITPGHSYVMKWDYYPQPDIGQLYGGRMTLYEDRMHKGGLVARVIVGHYQQDGLGCPDFNALVDGLNASFQREKRRSSGNAQVRQGPATQREQKRP